MYIHKYIYTYTGNIRHVPSSRRRSTSYKSKWLPGLNSYIRMDKFNDAMPLHTVPSREFRLNNYQECFERISHTINSYNSDPESPFTISPPLPFFFFLNDRFEPVPMFSMFRAKLNLTGSSLSANSVYQFPPSLPSLSSLRRLSIRVRKFDDASANGPLSSGRPFRNPNRGVTRTLHLNSNHSIIVFRYL